MVLAGAVGVVEEDGKCDALDAGEQRGDAEPKVEVRDVRVAVEVATGVEEGED